MSRAHIGIGSNIEPQRHVPWAMQHLREEFDGVQFAPIYTTAPIGRPEQPDYWNTMASLEVHVAREALEMTLRALEANAGRVRSDDKFAARELDLDIVLWNRTPRDIAAERELTERPWNQWLLHRLGDGPEPTTPEPALA